MSCGTLRWLAQILVAALVGAIPCLGAGEGIPGWVEVRSEHFVVSTNAGEAAGRQIAEQFEQIRWMFHESFTRLRVDPAQPVGIVAARDETTMKALLPDQWETPGHVHPAGLYQSGPDRDYVVMQVDAAGANPFHTIYHEYTHALLHLNFGQAPLWLEEGLAEFFGNSTLGDKGVKTGTLDKAHLFVLEHNELLPMETLFAVDNDSPYYNETTRASIFYAESWAVVHYLLIDPEARHAQLLGKFLLAWQKSGKQAEAAREAFGNLEQFAQTIKGYARQKDFRVGVLVAPQKTTAGNFTARNLPPGEVLALRGDLAVHRNFMEQARPLLEEAVQAEPNLAATHEALGFYKFRTQDFVGADQEMARAIELGSESYMALYCRGLLLVRDPAASEETTSRAAVYLEKAAKMNPQFAPAFEALTQVYTRSAETQGKALEAATKAVQLDPGLRTYQITLTYVLLNNGKIAEARTTGQKLLATAASEDDRRISRALLERVSEEEEWLQQSGEEARLEAEHGADASGGGKAGEKPEFPAIAKRRLGPPEWMATEGPISAIDCSHSPEILLTLNLPKGPITFHIKDFGKIGVSGVSEATTPEVGSCKQWTGRKVKIQFRFVQGGDYLGEIFKIHFYP